MTTATADVPVTTAPADVREELLEKTEEVEENLAEARPESPQRSTQEARLKWCREVEDAVLDLCNVLPEGVANYEGKLLLVYMVELRRAIVEDPEAEDGDGRVELKRLQMLDVVKRIERRLQHDLLDVPDVAARFVFDRLNSLSATELAKLLGVSTKTIGAWRGGSPVKHNVDQVTSVAQIVYNLTRSMTPRGIWLWFNSRQDALDNDSPLSRLSAGLEAGNEEWVASVKSLARGGRAQLAN